MSRFNEKAQKVLISSQGIAKTHQSQALEPEHLALALINTRELLELLKKKKIEYKSLESSLLVQIKNLPTHKGATPAFSGRLIKILGAAEALSIAKNHENISISDLFLSLVENKDKLGALGATLAGYFLSSDRDEIIVQKESKKIAKDSIINNVTENINNLIKNQKIDPVFGREDECERLIQVLSRKNRNNPILIGEPGVGRSSIVYALARRILEQKVPSHLVSKEILSLDIPALVAGTTLRGQFEERVRQMLMELKDKQGQYILLIRDLAMLMGGSNDEAFSAANLLQPALNRGEIQLIGLATPEVYRLRIESNASFERFFQAIWVNEPSRQESTAILEGLKEKYEVFHGVFIEDGALEAAIDLGAKHMSGKVLPAVALDLLDEACSRHRLGMDELPKKISDINERLLNIETELSSPQLKKSDVAKKQKQADKLKAEQVEKQEQYTFELSVIESMRAIKNELAIAKSQINSSEAQGDIKTAALLKSKTESELTEKFLARQKELLAIKKDDRLINPWVSKEDIATIVSMETGIPAQKMIQSEREKLATMEMLISAQVIGQKEAISAVSNAIRRARVGLKDQKKPIGSFLFLGPTGVGKTELARSLTTFLFDDERAMIRFDMSEFMERHTVARLIGAPPGYQGAEEGGQLTEAVRRKPFSVVLFDEIEKAHPDVLNVLLQVLDEGRLTDSKGQLVHFNNTVIIMTSNVGSDILLNQENSNILPEKIKDQVMELLLVYLRPELINRIDEIVIFNPLTKENIADIANIVFKNLTKLLAQEGYGLVIDQKVQSKLIEEGYNRQFGARPLKRSIQRLLENPLSLALVKSGFNKGDVIKARIDESQTEGSILFSKA